MPWHLEGFGPYALALPWHVEGMPWRYPGMWKVQMIPSYDFGRYALTMPWRVEGSDDTIIVFTMVVIFGGFLNPYKLGTSSSSGRAISLRPGK